MPENRTPFTFSPMRQAIARRMTLSKQTAPHVYLSTEIELDALLEAVDRHNDGRDREGRASITAFLVRALTHALLEHPAFNATWNGDILELVGQVNIGVAIDLPDGLIAPALLDCASMDVDGVAAALRDLVARTRAGKLRAREISDATFTLTNLGMVGDITQFAAIITPPQVGILAIGKAIPRPVVRNHEIVVRRVLGATLSADHRAVDGAAAARFLQTLKDLVEAPQRWLA